jgi:hypothetical protein
MEPVKYTPLLIILVAALLCVFGASVRTYPLPVAVRCAYSLAEWKAPAADILFVGASRVGQGIDPGYIQNRLGEKHDQDLRVERLELNFPTPTQFLPLVRRYVEERGSPKYVFLQLLYNFKSDRHRSWDLPVNGARNIAFERIPRLLEIRDEAALNDYPTVLPRNFEKGHQSALQILLFKLELNILSAVKFHAVKAKKELAGCQGEEMHRHQNPRLLYNSISDRNEFIPETSTQTIRRTKNLKTAADFMPLNLRGPHRIYENVQMQHLIDLLEESGSKVILMTMPALGETQISDSTLDDISFVFTENKFVHPYTLFSGEFGEELAISFKDTHHATKFGALQYSKFYADYIHGLQF